MATRRIGRSNPLGDYPVRDLLLKDVSQTGGIVLVDVGGNQGHDLVQLRDEYPELTEKLVLQDLPAVIAKCEVENLNGIDLTPHDFFTPQPVKARSISR